MDDATAQRLAALLDEAAEEAEDFQDIAQGLRQHVGEFGEDAERLLQAFEYLLRRQAEDRDASHQVTRFDDGSVYPMEVADVPAETLEVWEDVSEYARSAAARARLNDLLFERRVGNGRTRVETAVDAYLELAQAWLPVHATRLLPRALDLAQRVGAHDRADEGRRVAADLIAGSLELDEPKPGVPLRLLRMLVDDGWDHAIVDELLERARRALPSVWDATAIIAMQRRRAADEDARERLDREFVTEHLRMAEASRGFLRAHHLEAAAAYADQHGVTDLRGEALRLRQAMTADDFDFRTVTTNVEIPREHVEGLIEQYLNAEGWCHALLRFAQLHPPTGRVDQNRQAVEEEAAAFPLQAILNPTLVGGDGLPRFQAASEEDRFEVALARHEQIHLQLWAGWGLEILRRLVERFGRPDPDELEACLQQQPQVSPGLARSLRRALGHLWDGEYEAAVGVAMPRIEALCRALVLMMDEPIYQLQRAERPGQYPALRRLLEALSDLELLPESWQRYLNTTFVNVTGLNLRNEHAHGLVDEPGPFHAVVTVHAALFLATLPMTAGDPSDDDRTGTAPT